MTIDTATGDRRDASDDEITIAAAGLRAPGLKSLTVKTGDGDDLLSLATGDTRLPVAGGGIEFVACRGRDELCVEGLSAGLLEATRLLSQASGNVVTPQDE